MLQFSWSCGRSVSCRLVYFSKSLRRVLSFPRMLVVINPMNDIRIPLACSKSFFSAQTCLTRRCSCWKCLRCDRFWLCLARWHLVQWCPPFVYRVLVSLEIVGSPFARRFLDLESYALKVIVKSWCRHRPTLSSQDHWSLCSVDLAILTWSLPLSSSSASHSFKASGVDVTISFVRKEFRWQNCWITTRGFDFIHCHCFFVGTCTKLFAIRW